VLKHRLAKPFVMMLAQGAILALPSIASAQTASPGPTGTDVFSNMPGTIFVLIPLVIAAALYLGHVLGKKPDDSGPERRQGPVSRALAAGERTDGEGNE